MKECKAHLSAHLSQWESRLPKSSYAWASDSSYQAKLRLPSFAIHIAQNGLEIFPSLREEHRSNQSFCRRRVCLKEWLTKLTLFFLIEPSGHGNGTRTSNNPEATQGISRAALLSSRSMCQVPTIVVLQDQFSCL